MSPGTGAGAVSGVRDGWRLSLRLTRAAFEALEPALADHADAVVAETVAAAHPARDAPEDTLRATLFGTPPAADDPRPARLLALLQGAGIAPEDATLEPERAADWGARSLAAFPPLSVGRFTIAGGHAAAPHRRLTLSVDAGPAFGSGRHERSCPVPWCKSLAPGAVTGG